MLMKTLFGFFVLLSVANGLWMLAAPYAWYVALPASVPDTGPFNPHFVRDIGVTFVILGAGFGWCATHLDRCYPVHLGLTAWFIGHAAIHAADILTGRLPYSHWGSMRRQCFCPRCFSWRSCSRRYGEPS